MSKERSNVKQCSEHSKSDLYDETLVISAGTLWFHGTVPEKQRPRTALKIVKTFHIYIHIINL